MKHRAATLSVTAFLLLCSGCHKNGRLRVLPITHIAVGGSATLVAYEEERQTAGSVPATSAINPVTATWSVSDPSILSIESGGKVTGIKEGHVNLRAVWEGQEIVTPLEVVRKLNVGWLPQLSAEGMSSSIDEIKVSLSADSTLRFRAGFNDSRNDVTLEQKAPPQQFPWEFQFERGSLELTSASGHTVSGALRLKTGGAALFTVWSDDDGTYPVSLKDKTVLLVGDSMAEGLGWFLREKIETAGARCLIESRQSSTIPRWENGELKELIERDKPDVLFISLGSNELFVMNPEQTRAPLIKQLTKDIGDLPAFWIGPPSWKPDNGLVRVIEANFQPDHFYNSNDLKVPRRSDGAHPTREGFETWANLIWDWYARTR